MEPYVCKVGAYRKVDFCYLINESEIGPIDTRQIL